MIEEQNMTKNDAWQWVVVATNILQRVDLTDKDKLLYLHIASLTPSTGLFYGNNASLMEITGYTEKEIQTSLQNLEANQIITLTNSEEYERVYFVDLDVRG